MLRPISVSLVLASATVCLSFAEGTSTPPASGVLSIELAPVRPFSDAQLARVSEWIRHDVPSFPAPLVVAAAERLLNELPASRREQLETLLANGAADQSFRSDLFRNLAAVATGPQHAALREALAPLRATAVLRSSEPETGESAAEELLAKVKTLSPVQHRRLLEGRADDEEVLAALRRAAGDAARRDRVVAPKVTTAADIVSEFSRRNQVGSATERIQAYALEATLKAGDGELQHFVLYRMRPDRFRMAVRSGGLTRTIIASSGRGFWRQMADQPPQACTAADLGDLANLGEFVNPMFRQEGYRFTRLDDGTFDQRKVYRLKVVRPDASEYVSCIDQENYREIARELGEGAVVRLSDFREVAGVTFSFREEITDAQQQKAVVEIVRLRANPGIVQALFEQPESGDYFKIERLLAGGAPLTEDKP